MNEDIFNMELRKFLKLVGITSQREIERTVQAAIDAGTLKGTETLAAEVTLTVGTIGLKHRIGGEIALE